MEKKGTASELFLPNRILYVGLDESNHGHPREIVVGAMSGLEEKIIPGKYKKQRNGSLPDSLFNEIDYSFLVISKRNQGRVSEPSFIGAQISSLLQDVKNPTLESLNLFLDGLPLKTGRPYVLDMVSEVCSIPKEKIIFNFGAKYDEIYPLVNMADAIAYHIAFNSDPDSWWQNSHRKDLVR